MVFIKKTKVYPQFRDQHGVWQFGFCAGGSEGDPLAAEFAALRMGLHLLWWKNILKAYCESNCKEVVDLLTKEQFHLHEYASMFMDIHLLLAHQRDIRLRHIPGEANGPVDCLADYGASQQCDFTCFEVPSDIVVPASVPGCVSFVVCLFIFLIHEKKRLKF